MFEAKVSDSRIPLYERKLLMCCTESTIGKTFVHSSEPAFGWASDNRSKNWGRGWNGQKDDPEASEREPGDYFTPPSTTFTESREWTGD